MATAKTAQRAGLVLAMGVGAAVLPLGEAQAQNNRSNRNPGKFNVDPAAPLVDRLLQRGRTESWVLTVNVYYPGLLLNNMPVNANGVIRPDFAYPGRQISQRQWDTLNEASKRGVFFETGAMVFPMPLATAGHMGQMGTFESKITVDGRDLNVQPIWTENYQSGARLGRWEMKQVEGKRLRLEVKIPMTCWETFYNEEEANKVDWPTEAWAGVGMSALEPVYLVEWADQEAEIGVSKSRLDDLVNKRWLAGRDPKTIKPAFLAKELAGRVLEFSQPGKGQSEYGQVAGTFRGVLTHTVVEMLDAKRVYDLDPPVLLAAVYRHVGIPARTVYGYDLADKEYRNRNEPTKLHCWTEFALQDPKTKAAVWIPVDIVKMRWNGSRAQRIDRAWEYFGKNEDLAWTLPISFHVHPPTSVYVRSLPAFWGWLCTPEIPPYPHTLTLSYDNQNSRQLKKNNPDKKP